MAPVAPKASRFTTAVPYPPLLQDHPRWIQVILAVVGPILFGALTGYILGVSAGAYLVLSILGVSAVLAPDHQGAVASAKRGLLGGALFGCSFLITHEIHGVVARATLPDPAILLPVVTTPSPEQRLVLLAGGSASEPPADGILATERGTWFFEKLRCNKRLLTSEARDEPSGA